VNQRRPMPRQTHAPPGYVCPFCLVARGIENEHVYTVESDVVYRAGAVTAFVASHQWPGNEGNVLVIPNGHFENVYDFPPELAVELQRAVRAVALALKAALGCDGVSTRQHNEPAGSQDVWHYHVHVTPRYEGDDLYRRLIGQRAMMPVNERAGLADRIRAQSDQTIR
jgi:histidine triad (HIT) family protein